MHGSESDIFASYRAPRHRRADPRSRLFGSAYLILPDRSLRVRIMNLSLSGALLHCPHDLYARFEGRLVADYIDRGVSSVWMGYKFLGVRFMDRLTSIEFRDVMIGAGRARRAHFGKRLRG